jgi:hypothetical protein
MRVSAVDEVQVRMAEPAGGIADQHLVWAGLGDLQLFDFERLARLD